MNRLYCIYIRKFRKCTFYCERTHCIAFDLHCILSLFSFFFSSLIPPFHLLVFPFPLLLSLLVVFFHVSLLFSYLSFVYFTFLLLSFIFVLSFCLSVRVWYGKNQWLTDHSYIHNYQLETKKKSCVHLLFSLTTQYFITTPPSSKSSGLSRTN